MFSKGDSNSGAFPIHSILATNKREALKFKPQQASGRTGSTWKKDVHVPHATHTPRQENKEDESLVDKDFALKTDIPNERLELALTNTITQTKKMVIGRLMGTRPAFNVLKDFLKLHLH
jgi:hypothetical protein